MTLDIYQIDAFASKLFEGNPAAICPLQEWLPDHILQQIAMENNLSETAFFIEEGERFHLRWFTPRAEVDLCGHATLATAHLIFTEFHYDRPALSFQTKSGELRVEKRNDWYFMNFPATPFPREAPPLDLYHALGGVIADEVYKTTKFMWVVDKEEKVHTMDPDFTALARVDVQGVIVTAPGNDDDIDFVSRFFAPAVGVDEDPVTGSAHTMLVPYWAQRLGKRELMARQVSARGGTLRCRLLDNDRVEIAGRACTYMKGQIMVEI